MEHNLGWKQISATEHDLARILGSHLCISYSAKTGNYVLSLWLCLVL